VAVGSGYSERINEFSFGGKKFHFLLQKGAPDACLAGARISNIVRAFGPARVGPREFKRLRRQTGGIDCEGRGAHTGFVGGGL